MLPEQSDGERSDSSRSTPGVTRCFGGTGPTFRSTTTSGRSTAFRPTSSRAATRASRSVQPHEGETLPMIFGPTCSGSSATSVPVGSLLKTLLAEGYSTLSGQPLTWKRKATPHSFSIWRLRLDGISARELSLRPTPTAKANHDAPSMRKWPAYARQQDEGGISPSRWEWMLGYPDGWTDCTCLATPSSYGPQS